MPNLALITSSPNNSEASQLITTLNTLRGNINSQVQGALYIAPATVNQPADTSEDTLQSFTIPASAVAVGKTIRITAAGTCAANGNTKTMKVYYGASLVATPAAATNNKNWWLQLTVTLTAAATQNVNGWGCVDTTMVTPTNTAGADNSAAASSRVSHR
jgi:hypothetical protein